MKNRASFQATQTVVMVAVFTLVWSGLAVAQPAAEDGSAASTARALAPSEARALVPSEARALVPSEARVVTGEFESDLLPRTMNYGVLLPPGYDESSERYPVLFQLYPGPPESHVAIRRWRRHIEVAWASGRLPKTLVVTPAVGFSLYLDAHGEGRKWEQALMGPFLDHLRARFRIWEDRAPFYATGLSAGGAITLRLGLAHPEKFGAIAALAPGIEAAFTLDELNFDDTFWRPQNHYEGTDPEAWAEVNPLNMAKANAERIREHQLAIYLECGDEDSFMLHRGTELLHRVLSDERIRHEYHLRRGVDHHVGTIMPARWQAVYAFFGAHMRDLPKEAIVSDLQKALAALRAQAEKGIPNDPRLRELRAPLFGFSRQQVEIENEVLAKQNPR